MNDLYKEKLRNNLALYGFDTFKTNYFKSKSFDMLLHTFRDYEEIPEVNVGNTDIQSSVKFGEDFIKRHVDERNIKVPFLEHDVGLKISFKYGFNLKEKDYKSLIEYFDSFTKKINVYDIPVYFKYELDNSMCFQISPKCQNANVSFYKMAECVNYYIEIGMNTFDLNSSYVHEMYHALLSKGYTKNYLYDEVLSKFSEYIVTQEMGDNVLRENMKSNLNETKLILASLKSNHFADVLDARKYIISLLLSTSLYEIYKNGNDNVKKEINDDINKIIGKGIILEDLLNKYNVSEEEGSKVFIKERNKLRKN